MYMVYVYMCVYAVQLSLTQPSSTSHILFLRAAGGPGGRSECTSRFPFSFHRREADLTLLSAADILQALATWRTCMCF